MYKGTKKLGQQRFHQKQQYAHDKAPLTNLKNIKYIIH